MAAPHPSPLESNGSRLITGEAVALDLRPTGFVLRAAGTLIDFVAYFVVLYVGLTLLLFTLSGLFLLDDAVSAAASVALLVVSLIVVPTAVETITHGRSLGKLAVGARIVRDDGGAIGFRHAFIRNLMALLEIYSTVGGLAALTGLLNERSKRLGDYLAGTYSQNERVRGVVPPVFGVPTALLEWSRTADVASLPDPLARRVAQFLSQAPRLVPGSRARLAGELATEVAAFVSPVPAADPELFLAAVAAMRRERELAALRLSAKRLEALQPALTGLPHRFPPR